MQVARPSPVGDARVVEALRQVLFSEPILGAAGDVPRALNAFRRAAGPLLERTRH